MDSFCYNYKVEDKIISICNRKAQVSYAEKNKNRKEICGR